ncbi:MAG: YitT family protein [Oscillospiraceae bacterium]|nr:YitT family protein [Oscillospiraceae bacterium]
MGKGLALRFKNFAVDIGCDILGSLLFAISVNMFTAPNNIAPGGVTGIATLINYLTDAPIGTVSLLINVPLLIISYKALGKHLTLRTLKTIFIMTLMLDIVTVNIPPYQGDKLLACIFAGVLGGIGLGVVFMRGSTTGGADIINRILKKRFPHISIGKITLFFDSMVLISSAFVYHSMESALYALITIFVETRMVDSIIVGLDRGKVLYIISNKSAEIGKAITVEIGRGATLLSGTGVYSNQERQVLMCAVRNHQYPAVKKIAHRIDPYSFMVVTDAGEILGEGFRGIDSTSL